jgi:hypothetical protein
MKRYSNVMNKSNRNIQQRVRGNIKGKKFQKRAAKRFVELHSRIMYCLQEMDSELLLVFKVMDYISSIDNKLGRPVNNYYYTAKYSFKNTIKESKSFLQYVMLNIYMYKTLFMFVVYEYFLKLGLTS